MRLTPLAKAGEPVLVGSDLHVSMGAAEITTVAATPRGMTVTLDGNAGARAGNLYIHSPRPLEVQSASGCEVTLTAENDSIYRVAVRARARDTANRIHLIAR